MAKDATLTAGVLVDDLVPVVDDIRRSLFDGSGNLGVRASDVHVVVRTWSGTRRGEGTPTDAVTVLDPTPRIVGIGPDGRLRPAGLEEEGQIALTQVSLVYAESELYRADESLALNQEFFVALVEKHGQSARTRYYVPSGPPIAHRGNSKYPAGGAGMGWLVRLRRTSDVPNYPVTP